MRDSTDMLRKLESAIRVNMMSPRPDEWMKFGVDKMIRVSPHYEDDSQLGMVLFAGIANIDLRIAPHEICEYGDMDAKEFGNKLTKYIDKVEALDPKYLRKIQLIKNAIKLNN